MTASIDFFTNERARADYKQRLRYLVARYGYSTSIFAWEFFNEVIACQLAYCALASTQGVDGG